jgi:S1-C subfamily serine protease
MDSTSKVESMLDTMSDPTEPTESIPPPLKERAKRFGTKARTPLLFFAGVIAALLAVLLYGAVTPPPKQLTAREVNDTIKAAMASATPPPAFSVGVHRAIMPSFVLVQTQGEAGAGSVSDGDTRGSSGLGSGVVINDQGAILTSLHVVKGASEIKVTFADGTESPAMVVTEQPENDIAVLMALNPPAQIFPATLGNPASLRVGDEVYAVGNPLGLYGSMSAGVVSGLKRSFKPETAGGTELKELIQFDAAVNPGNSGGPLLNRYGQVVGIVAALVNPSGDESFSGIGFAVPINVAGGGAGMPPY